MYIFLVVSFVPPRHCTHATFPAHLITLELIMMALIMQHTSERLECDVAHC
jgi:hypothetical protein